MPTEGMDKETPGTTVVAQFYSLQNESTGPPLVLPVDITVEQLEKLLNELRRTDQEQSEQQTYAFYVHETEVLTTLNEVMDRVKASTEQILPIQYRPQAVFRVHAVTRCSSSIIGHAEAILSVSFSPDGCQLASGSGDTTVRLWDIFTETPLFTLKGHKNWVLCIAWSPNGQKLVSGSMDNMVQLWNPSTGEPIGAPLRGHSKCITSLAWEPLHLNRECTRFASASKDGTVCIWDTLRRQCLFTLSQHTDAITCIKWGGDGLIYTSSRDRTIRVWDGKDGKLFRVLDGHGHWVNTMALNTDYVLRTGSFDPMHNPLKKSSEMTESLQQAAQKAFEKFNATKKGTSQFERLVSGSDDYTLFLWSPAEDKKPLARMTGHQQLVNQVCFSPDDRYIASASFDKSVRLWESTTGSYIATLRGHVAAVYQVSWSADSRLLVSASKDSSLKIWDIRMHKVLCDLPGHADEVYAVDWSPDGERVASGGKDRLLKIWRT